jgi:hypothetical protein
MALKSLAYTEADHEAMMGDMKTSPMPSDYVGPKYPWGLQLSFDDATLEKMGMSATDFKPGTDMPIEGVLRITGISISEREDGTKCQCVNAVLSSIDTETPKTPAEAAEMIYDKGK